MFKFKVFQNIFSVIFYTKNKCILKTTIIIIFRASHLMNERCLVMVVSVLKKIYIWIV